MALLSRSDCENEYIAAVADESVDGSVINAIRSTLRVSRAVRDRISHDTWRILSTLDEAVAGLVAVDGQNSISQLVNALNYVIIALAGFSGLVMESMTRGFAWRFLDMGRRLERAVNLVALMRATLVEHDDRESSLIEAVLDVADSRMTYRRRYPAGLQTAPTVDLLLADDANPRGVIFQLKTLAEHINALPPQLTQGVRTAQQRLVLLATSQIELSDINALCELGDQAQRRITLDGLLRQLGMLLPQLSDSLTETYLYHADVARHLRHAEADSNTNSGPPS